MLDNLDWHQLTQLETVELRAKLFDIFQDAAVAIHDRDPDDPTLLGIVPRMADILATRKGLADFAQPFSSLARSVGLWNYIDKTQADIRDTIVAEAVSVPQLGGIVLHRDQITALNALLAGRNLILSAPTSFGKSILVDALLLSGRYRRIAIVLPTIALLDEFRRRLVDRFGDAFSVLMHHSEKADGDRVIFLGTQERLINREDLGQLDLVVVDEFYKLDPARKDDRSITLNAAVYRLLRVSKQFFS